MSFVVIYFIYSITCFYPRTLNFFLEPFLEPCGLQNNYKTSTFKNILKHEQINQVSCQNRMQLKPI